VPTEITDATFEAEVLQSTTPVLVDFYADWCGPCKAAAPTIETLAKEFEGKVKVVKLNVDTGSENAVKYGVRGIPNFTLFKNGTVFKQLVGAGPALETNLRDAADAALAEDTNVSV
jgi:thioredoxin 1